MSRDRGQTWSESEGFRRILGRWWWFSPAESLFKAYVDSIVVSPTDPSLVIAGIELGAVVRSADGGHTWSKHCAGAGRDCHMLATHATDGRWIYEAGGGGPAQSSDAGLTWTKRRAGLDRRYAYACCADPADPELWYLAASPGPGTAYSWANARANIFRFANGAWEKLRGGLPQPIVA